MYNFRADEKEKKIRKANTHRKPKTKIKTQFGRTDLPAAAAAAAR